MYVANIFCLVNIYFMCFALFALMQTLWFISSQFICAIHLSFSFDFGIGGTFGDTLIDTLNRGPTVRLEKVDSWAPEPNCLPRKSGHLGPGAWLFALKKWTIGPRTVGSRGPKCLEPMETLVCDHLHIISYHNNFNIYRCCSSSIFSVYIMNSSSRQNRSRCCITVDTVCALLATAERYIQYKCTKFLIQKVHLIFFLQNFGTNSLQMHKVSD